MSRNLQLYDLTFYEMLGEGAYGTVSRVTFNEPYIGEVQAAAKNLRHLRREEIQVLERLNHPHIVGLYGSIQNGPITLIILEYAPHKTVRDYIETNPNRPTPNQLLLKWSRESVSALEYLHKNKVLHRDIKGSNCLLFEDLLLKLSDFGLARELDTSMTTSSIKGTLVYMAPEIHKDGHYSYGSDMYAYGMLLLEIASGKPPFFGTEWPHAVYEVTKNGHRPNVPSSCPDYIAEIIQQCWHSDRKLRPSAENVAKRLQECSGNTTLSQHSMAVVNTSLTASPPDSERKSTHATKESESQHHAAIATTSSTSSSGTESHTSLPTILPATVEEQLPSDDSPPEDHLTSYKLKVIEPLSNSLCKKVQKVQPCSTSSFISRSYRSSSMHSPRSLIFPLQNQFTSLPKSSTSYPNLLSGSRVDLENPNVNCDEQESIDPEGSKDLSASELHRSVSTPNLDSMDWQDISTCSSKTLQKSIETVDSLNPSQYSGFPKPVLSNDSWDAYLLKRHKLSRTVSVPALGKNIDSIWQTMRPSHSLLSVGTHTCTTGTQTSSSMFFDEIGSVNSVYKQPGSVSLLNPIPERSTEQVRRSLHSRNSRSVPCLQDVKIVGKEMDDPNQSSIHPWPNFQASNETMQLPSQVQSNINLVGDLPSDAQTSTNSKCCKVCVIL